MPNLPLLLDIRKILIKLVRYSFKLDTPRTYKDEKNTIYLSFNGSFIGLCRYRSDR